MAAGDATAGSDDRCTIAADALTELLVEECGPDGGLQRNIGRLLGTEPDPDCEAALDEGLDEETLESTVGTRQWVGCRAQQLIREEGVALSVAMERAWEEAKTAAANHGIEL